MALGPRLEPGDEVLDLACGDGGLGEALLARGVRYRGVDSTPEMVAAAQLRLGARAEVVAGDLNDLHATRSGRGDDGVPGDLLRARSRRLLRARSPRTRRRSSSSTSIRGSTASRTSSMTSARRASAGRAPTVLRPADRLTARPRSLRSRRRSSEAARSHVPRSARASPISSRPRASRRTAAGTGPGR